MLDYFYIVGDEVVKTKRGNLSEWLGTLEWSIGWKPSSRAYCETLLRLSLWFVEVQEDINGCLVYN